LLPKAIAWAEDQARRVATSGRALTEVEREVARAVGVAEPERIRVALVDVLPMPEDPDLVAAAVQTGLVGPGMVGLTLGHSIFIGRGHENVRLLSHEFRHVHQYEDAGSIAAFLPGYLRQIVEFGYANTPLEADAAAHERTDA
jgi:sugar (pentulose or hexulose) kinase